MSILIASLSINFYASMEVNEVAEGQTYQIYEFNNVGTAIALPHLLQFLYLIFHVFINIIQALSVVLINS